MRGLGIPASRSPNDHGRAHRAVHERQQQQKVDNAFSKNNFFLAAHRFKEWFDSFFTIIILLTDLTPMRVTVPLLLLLLLAAGITPTWASTQCLSDGQLKQIAEAGKQALQALKYNVSDKSGLDGLPFDFSFAPANYSGSGVNPSSRYVVPRWVTLHLRPLARRIST